MARPQKEGLDYFSVDCRFSDSVKLIQAEFGLIGLGILIRLWQKIYGEKGYYTKWDTDVVLVFASECNVGASIVNEVVSACLRRGLFDKNVYDRFNVLTSASIQERYADGTARRESQKVFADYLLISAPENWVIVDDNSVYVDNNSKKGHDNPQSKVNKSKVNKSKGKEQTTIALARDPIPTDLEIIAYFGDRLYEETAGVEALKFKKFNTSRGWDCLPEWKDAAERWIEKIKK